MVVSARKRVVALSGRVDVSTVSEVRATLHTAIDELRPDGACELIIDLTEVHAVDATGLGVLAGAHRRSQSRGQHLVLRGCCPQLRRALAVTRLARVLDIEREAS